MGERIIIEVDREFFEILETLEGTIRHITWDGIDKVGSKKLTKILAKKIKSAKLV